MKNKPFLAICPTSCGIHPNLQKIPKRNWAKKKVITCYNFIIFLVLIHQIKYTSNGMFDVDSSLAPQYISKFWMHFKSFGINQTTNFHYLSIEFCFHVLMNGKVLCLIFHHHVLHSNIVHISHCEFGITTKRLGSLLISYDRLVVNQMYIVCT